MSQSVPIVAIVGRTNVGKSTLFNAFAKRRLAIVEDHPGVTRDRNYVLISQYGPAFMLVDTGGLVGEHEGNENDKLLESVRQQAELAIEQSDLVLALFDGIQGLQAYDSEVVDLLRRSGKKVLWVINKCEKPLTDVFSAEFYALGLDELQYVAAAHRMGINELARKIQECLGILNSTPEADSEQANQAIKVAVLGRPNVGKSTLINAILGENRLIASELAGTTRDSIDTEYSDGEQRYLLIDTAGLRRKARVEAKTLERYGNLRTLRSLARCDVAILILDATQGLPAEQEQKIAKLIHERGRGLVLVVNKWDAIEKDHTTVQQYKEAIRSVLRFVQYAPILFTCALTGRRCQNVLAAVKEVQEARSTRIPTSELNRVFKRAFDQNQPAVHRGLPVKLFFATQIDVAPPTIVLVVSNPKGLAPSYLRYLKQCLRESHPFPGVDVKFVLKKRGETESVEADTN